MTEIAKQIEKPLRIKIKYFDKTSPKVKKYDKGAWFDLYTCGVAKLTTAAGEDMTKMYQNNLKITDTIKYLKGSTIRFLLGVGMKLPSGYEALLASRSGTHDKYGFIQTNAPGVIDNSYSGDNDQWMIEFYATRDGEVNLHDRLCQFRIQKKQGDVLFDETDKLGEIDRGGHGKSGR